MFINFIIDALTEGFPMSVTKWRQNYQQNISKTQLTGMLPIHWFVWSFHNDRDHNAIWVCSILRWYIFHVWKNPDQLWMRRMFGNKYHAQDWISMYNDMMIISNHVYYTIHDVMAVVCIQHHVRLSHERNQQIACTIHPNCSNKPNWINCNHFMSETNLHNW